MQRQGSQCSCAVDGIVRQPSAFNHLRETAPKNRGRRGGISDFIPNVGESVVGIVDRCGLSSLQSSRQSLRCARRRVDRSPILAVADRLEDCVRRRILGGVLDKESREVGSLEPLIGA